jgi:hypothetical protein
VASSRARRLAFARHGWARGRALWAVRQLYRRCRFERTADGRAVRLLRQWLRPEQLAQLTRHGHFDVVGSRGGTRYRIYDCGRIANVRVLDDDGEVVAGLCFHPIGELPSADVMLAQKIALETDEHAALAVANRFLTTSLPPGRGFRLRPSA